MMVCHQSSLVKTAVSSCSSLRAPAGRASREGVHPQDVCGSEPRQRQDHLLTLHLRHGHGEHPLRLRRREGHHPAAQPQRVQPGVGRHRRGLLAHVSTGQTHTLLHTYTHTTLNYPQSTLFSSLLVCFWFFLSSRVRVFQTFPAFTHCLFCQSPSTFSRRQLVSSPSLLLHSLHPALLSFPLNLTVGILFFFFFQI